MKHTPADFLSYTASPATNFLGAISLVMNPQSRGTISLRSSNPADAPIIDPKFLSHPFDRRVMIDGLRETMRLFKAPIFVSRTVEWIGPNLDSDDETIMVSNVYKQGY
jgi:choline dehydrogenase-like flavoprotein